MRFVAFCLALLTLLAFHQVEASAQSREEAVLWTAIKDSTIADDYQAYLDAYPNGTFAPLAKRRLAALVETKSAAATRLERGKSEIRRLVGGWSSGRYEGSPGISTDKDWNIAELHVRNNAAGGATGEFAIYNRAVNSKGRESAICETHFVFEFLPSEDATISWKVLSGRVRCYWYKEWRVFGPGVSKELEFTGEKLRLHFFRDSTVDYDLVFSKL